MAKYVKVGGFRVLGGRGGTKALRRSIPAEYKGCVDEAYHDSDGYWVYLKDGWTDSDTDAGTIHEDTIAAVLYHLRHYVRRETPEERARREG